MHQASLPLKPWTPQNGEECQFKCCPYCRPSLQERAWLPLDAIVNADIPLTAVHGFGFHLSDFKQRPVSDVNVVKNLGLREPPPPVRISLPTQESRVTFSSDQKVLQSALTSIRLKPPKASESSPQDQNVSCQSSVPSHPSSSQSMPTLTFSPSHHAITHSATSHHSLPPQP